MCACVCLCVCAFLSAIAERFLEKPHHSVFDEQRIESTEETSVHRQ